MAFESSARSNSLVLVEGLLNQQRERWRRGERPLVEMLIQAYPTLTSDREGLLDLVWNEVDLRASFGDAPQLAEYCRRFPHLSDDLCRLFEVQYALGPSTEAARPTDAAADVTIASPAPKAELPGPWHKAGYDILEKLGQGAMGVVYKARQKSLNRLVALKMIRDPVAGDPELLERFRSEAEAAARLQHPNIVQIYEVGEREGQPFLALEFVTGGGLDKRLAGTPIAPKEAARLVEIMARAVQHAHRRGVVHRDLKPGNILLEDGVPKIADFGLAKLLGGDSGRTQAGSILGTPSYMAPEQAAGAPEQIGPATDIYALGAILYEMLTGRPPFRAENTLETLLQILNQEPVPPRQLQPKVPHDLETICLKCLQKAPAKRYATAEVLADDLQRFLKGQPILARPSGPVKRLWRWCRRSPKDAGLAAAALLAAVVGTVSWRAIELDRYERQSKATTEAERNLTEAELLWQQAQEAPVGDISLWEKAAAAAGRSQAVIDSGAVDEPTRTHAAETLAGIMSGKEAAESKAATAAADQRRKAAEAAADEHMKTELEKLALSQLQLTTKDGKAVVDREFADGAYQKLFRAYGIDVDRPEEAERRIRASAIKPQLIAALDAWIPLRPDKPARRRLADLADRLSGPDEFRHKLHEALAAGDMARLHELAQRDLSAFPPHVLFDVALALTNSRALEAALALLRPAQQRYPADFGIAFQLAYCLGELDPPRTEESARFFTAAVAVQPQRSTPHNNLANSLAWLGRLDEAITEYHTAIRLDPTDATPHNGLGAALKTQQKWEEAAGEYRIAIRLAPKNPVFHDSLGVVLTLLGKLDEAIAEFHTAILLQPKYARAHYGLGSALAEQGKLDDAIPEFRLAVQLEPKSAEVRNFLGTALADRGKLDEAVQEFRTALQLDPKNAEAHSGLGRALAAQEKLDEAVVEYLTAIRLASQDAFAHSGLGTVYSLQGKVDEAITEYRAALRLNAKHAPAHFGLGTIFAYQGKTDEAIAEFRAAARLDPKSPEPHNSLGTILVDVGKTDEAISEFRRAIELAQESAKGRYNLALALARKGDFAAALQEFKKCQDLLPPSDPVGSLAVQQSILVEEMMRLERKLPFLLLGTARPANDREACDLATLCLLRQQYATSARLFAECFAGTRSLAEEPGMRFLAACVGALAGCGRGKDMAGLIGSERAQQRKQALDWLRADLDALAKLAGRDNRPVRQAVVRQLRVWQNHVDLACVREAAELSKLPEEERTAWLKFWADVAALVERAEKGA